MGTGGSKQSPWSRAFWRKKVHFLMIGLDAAGKTAILHRVGLGEVVTTARIAFRIERVEHDSVNMTVWWRLNTADKMIWRLVSRNTQAVVFVVDSLDRDRVEDAAEELFNNLNEDILRGLPLLVFANKQDLPFAMGTAMLIDKLRLNSVRDRAWHIQACSAVLGLGLYEGFDWLAKELVAPGKADHSLLALAPSPLPAVTHPGRYVVAVEELLVHAERPSPYGDRGAGERLPQGTLVDVTEVTERSELGAALVQVDAPVQGWCKAKIGDLEPSKAVLVAVHADEVAGTLRCTSVAGAELAAIDLHELPAGCAVQDLLELVAERVGEECANLELLLPGGQLASDAGADVLVDELLVAAGGPSAASGN